MKSERDQLEGSHFIASLLFLFISISGGPIMDLLKCSETNIRIQLRHLNDSFMINIRIQLRQISITHDKTQ